MPPAPAAGSPASDAPVEPVFRRLDTVILRVRDVAAAERWYRTVLGLEAAFRDEGERLAVLALEGAPLTLWERKPGEAPPPPSAAVSYPILACDDARQAREQLAARGAAVGPLVEGEGIRFFRFSDADGNTLEACQVL